MFDIDSSFSWNNIEIAGWLNLTRMFLEFLFYIWTGACRSARHPNAMVFCFVPEFAHLGRTWVQILLILMLQPVTSHLLFSVLCTLEWITIFKALFSHSVNKSLLLPAQLENTEHDPASQYFTIILNTSPNLNVFEQDLAAFLLLVTVIRMTDHLAVLDSRRSFCQLSLISQQSMIFNLICLDDSIF